MPLSIKIHNKSESISKFIPRDKPLMSFNAAFELVKKKYKDAFEYLKDK